MMYFAYKDILRWLSGKESACNAEDLRCGFNPWIWKILWSRKWAAYYSILAWAEEPAGCSP